MNNLTVCKEHSGFKAKIEKLEDDVSKLWEKWDGMQKILIGIFSGIVLNLLGWIIFLINKMSN